MDTRDLFTEPAQHAEEYRVILIAAENTFYEVQREIKCHSETESTCSLLHRCYAILARCFGMKCGKHVQESQQQEKVEPQFQAAFRDSTQNNGKSKNHENERGKIITNHSLHGHRLGKPKRVSKNSWDIIKGFNELNSQVFSTK